MSTFSKKDWEDIDGPNGPFNSGLELTEKPKLPEWLPKFVRERKPEDVRPLMFGTDTVLGVKVAWSGLTAQIPDTVRLAYARKELALSPVTLRPMPLTQQAKKLDAGAEPFIAQAPSLLATTDALLDTGGFLDTSFNYIQYFATGRAATALALRHAVRQSMIKRFDPEQILAQRKVQRDELQVELRAKEDGTVAVNARKKTINNWLADSTSVDPTALQTEATNLQRLADSAHQKAAGVAAGPDPLLTAEAEAQTKADAAKKRATDATTVATALGPPTPATVKQGDINQFHLLEWLNAHGYKVSVVKWLEGASLQELDLAIRELEME